MLALMMRPIHHSVHTIVYMPAGCDTLTGLVAIRRFAAAGGARPIVTPIGLSKLYTKLLLVDRAVAVGVPFTKELGHGGSGE